jgi:signal transduction histidine kinase
MFPKLPRIGPLALAVVLLAAVGLGVEGASSLYQAARYEQESSLAAQIDTGVNRLSALEWRARGQRGVDGEVAAALRKTHRSVESSYSKLAELAGDRMTSRTHADFDAYVQATTDEFALLSAGKLQAAARVDRQRVDPANGRLTAAIAKQTRHRAVAAKNAFAKARLLLEAALLATVILVALLVLIHRRTRLEDRSHVKRLGLLGRQRDAFVATVSHELRTPLTSICGYTELLCSDDSRNLRPEQQTWLEVIARSSERLQSLVNELLLLAEVDADKFHLNVADVDLTEIATQAAEAAQPTATRKNIQLTVSAADGLAVRGDAARLSQVLDNLISNALKFTPADGRIDVRAAVTGTDATIEISDTGSGIAADDQARLFDRFFRTEEATNQAVQGTGLGLAICKAIVDAHGGSITVESRLGRGSMFRIRLPGQPAAGEPKRAEPTLLAA